MIRRTLAVLLALAPLATAAPNKPEPAGSPPAPGRGARVLDDKDLEAMWKDLARDDDEGVKLARVHANAMVRSPATALVFLRQHLKPVMEPDKAKIAKWIEELDSGDFGTRESATRELGQLGVLAAPALKKKLDGPAPSLEARRRLEHLLEKLEGHTFSSDELRQRRAVDVLFMIGTPEARQVLEELARGAAGAPLTEQARISLAALKVAKPSSPR